MFCHLAVLIYLCGEVTKKGWNCGCPFERKGNWILVSAFLYFNSKVCKGAFTNYVCIFWHLTTKPTPPSLHFLRSKCSIFWTTYPLLNAKVICEGSLSLFKILHWLKIRGGWISAWEMPFLFSSRKKKTPSAKSERHVPSPENNSRGFRPNLSTTIAAATVTATYR